MFGCVCVWWGHAMDLDGDILVWMLIIIEYCEAADLIAIPRARADMEVDVALLFNYILVKVCEPQLEFQRPP